MHEGMELKEEEETKNIETPMQSVDTFQMKYL